MTIDPQVLYNLIGAHLSVVPPFEPQAERIEWMLKASSLVKAAGDVPDILQAKKAVESAIRQEPYDDYLRELHAVLKSTLYDLELKLPPGQNGAFIPAGNSHDAFAAIGRLLRSAHSEVLIVDAYMDAQALTTYAVTAAESVKFKLLSDSKGAKPDLKPAVATWQKQYPSNRPVEAKLAAAKKLHDRIVVVDENTVWLLTQSLNSFAARSPATILKMTDPQIVADKIAHYANEWSAATPI